MTTYLHLQKQDTEYHQCNLPGEPWNVITKFIESGLFVNCRRKLKKYTMISKNHPYTRSYAPSLNRLKQEEKVHLIEHYGIIHPLSMFALLSDLYFCLFFICHFLTAPGFYALMSNRRKRTYIMLPVNVSYLLMIIITFRTGVYNEKDNTVSLKPSHIAKTYLKSYFFLDLSSFSLQMLRLDVIHKYVPENVLVVLVPILVTSRYIRYLWILKVLKLARLYFGCSTFLFKAIRLTLNIIIMSVLSIYVLFAILPRGTEYDANKFFKQAETTLKLLMTVGYGKSVTESGPIQGPLLSCVFLCVGFVFHVIILVEVNSMWFKYFSAENKQTTVYESINAYTRYKALPLTLRDRIYLYLEFKYQGHFYKDSVLTKATAGFLRKEILLASSKNCLEAIPLFRNIPYHLLRTIRVTLSTEIFLPGDIIVKAGTKGRSMYFLLAGTVSVTSEKDREICQLRDGSYFGEAGLSLNMARFVNVIALTPCELFRLDRSKFKAILLKHEPDIYWDIERTIAEKVSLALRTDNLRAEVLY